MVAVEVTESLQYEMLPAQPMLLKSGKVTVSRYPSAAV